MKLVEKQERQKRLLKVAILKVKLILLGNRFEYSQNAESIHAGMRLPIAIRSNCINLKTIDFHGLFSPEFLKLVIFSTTGVHNVDNNITQINQHPFPFGFPLNTQGFEFILFYSLY